MPTNPGLAGQIDTFLKQKGSPLAGLGSVFVAAGRKYGVDPRLVVGISGIESSFGKYINGSYNAWGWGPGIPFASWEQGVSTITRGLKTGYLDQGRRTPAAIATKWAPASDGNDPAHWSSTVSQFMRELGASPGTTTSLTVSQPTSSSASNAARSVTSAAPTLSLPPGLVAQLTTPSTAGIEQAAIDNLGRISSQHGHVDPLSNLSSLVSGATKDRAMSLSNLQTLEQLRALTPSQALSPPSSSEQPPASSDVSMGKVSLAANANRGGHPIKTVVLDFVRKIAGVYGQPVVIGTGTNHNQFVSGTGNTRQSAHWLGNAVDIPADGAALTALGHAALVAAGMPEKQAMEANGGVYNIGPYQIIFNTYLAQGGNHWNHLHVGVQS